MPHPVDTRERFPIRHAAERFGQHHRPSSDLRRPERKEDPPKLSHFDFVLTYTNGQEKVLAGTVAQHFKKLGEANRDYRAAVCGRFDCKADGIIAATFDSAPVVRRNGYGESSLPLQPSLKTIVQPGQWEMIWLYTKGADLGDGQLSAVDGILHGHGAVSVVSKGRVDLHWPGFYHPETNHLVTSEGNLACGEQAQRYSVEALLTGFGIGADGSLSDADALREKVQKALSNGKLKAATEHLLQAYNTDAQLLGLPPEHVGQVHREFDALLAGKHDLLRERQEATAQHVCERCGLITRLADIR